MTEAPPITKAVDPSEKRIAEVQAHSVRQFGESTYGGILGDTVGFLWGARAELLPPWGTLECDIALRVMHYNQHNAIWSGGAEAYIEKFQSIPYEISGGRNLTFKWQDIFFDAEFGQGYDELMIPCLVDYLTLNRGFFIEKVAYGEPDTPIREGAKILGLNHLDALRIRFTGNRVWPYIYEGEYGGWHKMHYTRVIHIARQPSPNTRMFGMGKSALYDSLTVANSEILLGRHENEMLNDLPPPGIVIFNNVKADEVQTVMTQFQYERVRDGQATFRAPVQMSSFDPSQPATVTFVPLATVPQGFDKEKYTQIHVNTYALNLGLDPQDIWPLSAGAMGSGAQSKVLAAKTDIKGPGYLSTRMTRVWNVTLPESLEWKYKAQNAQQDREIAELAKMWVDTATSATVLTDDEKRQLIANQVGAFADVLLDEDGQVRLFDNDPKTVEQTVATDEVMLEGAPDDGDEVTTNSENETVMTEEAGQPVVEPDDEDVPATKGIRKEIDATNDAFIQEMTAIIQDGIDRTITKAGAGSRIRGAINRYGKAAYIDGLVVGGVPEGELDEDDRRIIGDLSVRDSQFVTNLVNEIYSEAGISGTAEARAQKWMGTTDEFYYEGIASADKNGMYEFTGDDGEESCKDCKRLKGEKHRMKWWIDKQLRPGVDHDSFECKAYNCQHYLERVKK